MNSLHPITPDLIAPCGMNCGLRLGYLREKNHCIGCLPEGGPKFNHCATYRIKNCEKLAQTQSGFCYDCEGYACKKISVSSVRNKY